MKKLSPFSHELAESYRLFRRKWKPLVKMVVLPIIPFLFTTPYLMEYYSAQSYGENLTLNGATLTLFLIALVALLTFLILSEIVKVGIFAELSSSKYLGVRRSLKIGTERFFRFIYTEILVVIFLFVSMIPAFILNYWYEQAGRELLNRSGVPYSGTFIIVVFALLFFLPSFILGIWLTFAPLISVVTKYRGMGALTHSVTITRPYFRQLIGRLVMWTVVFMAVVYSVKPLPIASIVVPLVMMLVGAAFVVTLFKEVHAEIKEETPKVAPRRNGKRRIIISPV